MVALGHAASDSSHRFMGRGAAINEAASRNQSVAGATDGGRKIGEILSHT